MCNTGLALAVCDNPRLQADIHNGGDLMTHATSKLLLALLCCGALLASVHAQISGVRAQTPGPILSPTTAEQYTEEGNKYAGAREYDKAVDAYRQAIKLNPNLAAAYHGL